MRCQSQTEQTSMEMRLSPHGNLYTTLNSAGREAGLPVDILCAPEVSISCCAPVSAGQGPVQVSGALPSLRLICSSVTDVLVTGILTLAGNTRFFMLSLIVHGPLHSIWCHA